MDEQMSEQKILFADIYRLLGSIRSEAKLLDKANQDLLYQMDWESATMKLNEIISEAQLIQKMAVAIETYTDMFVKCGPYEGQRGMLTPMEAMAE